MQSATMFLYPLLRSLILLVFLFIPCSLLAGKNTSTQGSPSLLPLKYLGKSESKRRVVRHERSVGQKRGGIPGGSHQFDVARKKQVTKNLLHRRELFPDTCEAEGQDYVSHQLNPDEYFKILVRDSVFYLPKKHLGVGYDKQVNVLPENISIINSSGEGFTLSYLLEHDLIDGRQGLTKTDSVSVLDILIRYGAPETIEAIFHLGCQSGEVSFVMKALDAGADVDSESYQGVEAPLYNAIKKKYSGIVNILLYAGASPYIDHSPSLVELALRKRTFDVVMMLVNVGVELDDNQAEKVFRNQNLDSAGILLQAGYKPSPKSATWILHESRLRFDSYSSAPAIIAGLKKVGATIEYGLEKRVAMHDAVLHKRTVILDLLLSPENCDKTKRSDLRELTSGLITAIKHRHDDIMERLVEAGGLFDDPDCDYEHRRVNISVLAAAVDKGSLKRVKFLLGHSHHENVVAQAIASEKGRLDILLVLLRARDNFVKTERSGSLFRVELIDAFAKDHMVIVLELIIRGADLTGLKKRYMEKIIDFAGVDPSCTPLRLDTLALRRIDEVVRGDKKKIEALNLPLHIRKKLKHRGDMAFYRY